MGRHGNLIPVDTARQIVLDSSNPLPTARVSLENSLGLVLAEAIGATIDMPPFDTSAMDGFALRAEDTKRAGAETPVSLQVQAVIRAGDPSPLALARSAAFKIMTGAVVPPLADAVIEKEAVEEHDGGILLRAPVPTGNHIRRRASDVPAGRQLLPAGQVIDAASLFLAAAAGMHELNVIRRPHAAVIATGDELVPYSQKPGAAQIRDTNSPLIGAFLKETGVEQVSGEVVEDSADTLARVLSSAVAQSDVVILSGGVSAGDFDVVRDVLRRIGAKELFAGVSQKPGKPMAFATAKSTPGSHSGPERRSPGEAERNTLIFALPGNPIAVLVCLYEYVRPGLLGMMGYPPAACQLTEVTARLSAGLTKKAGRSHFLRCAIDRTESGLVARVLEGQESYQIANLAEANGWIVLDPEVRSVPSGSMVRVHLLPGHRSLSRSTVAHDGSPGEQAWRALIEK